MIAFHSLFSELAQREVRCVHLGPPPDSGLPGLPADEYAYLEFYCAELDCDCRRVMLQVISKGQPGRIFATISYGWEKESFYRKRTAWDPDWARCTVRGELDPLNEQSEFATEFLDLFRDWCWTNPIACVCGAITGCLRRNWRAAKRQKKAAEIAGRPQPPESPNGFSPWQQTTIFL